MLGPATFTATLLVVGNKDHNVSKVIVDTGSSDLWVAGKDCENCNQTIYDRDASPTYASDGARVAIAYADGDGVAGVLARDTLAWGGVATANLSAAAWWARFARGGFGIPGARDGDGNATSAPEQRGGGSAGAFGAALFATRWRPHGRMFWLRHAAYSMSLAAMASRGGASGERGAPPRYARWLYARDDNVFLGPTAALRAFVVTMQSVARR